MDANACACLTHHFHQRPELLQPDRLDVAPPALLPIPVSGTAHAHTGCFRIECPMPGGVELWLLASGPCPRFQDTKPQFRLGQGVVGFLRTRGIDSEELQQRLERSAALTGLSVEWVELPYPGMRRWFQFRVEPGLLEELFRRLHGFASTGAAGISGEPDAPADGPSTPP
jgi:hypothetical protein